MNNKILMVLSVLALSCLALILNSCGKEAQETKDAIEVISKSQDIAEKTQQNMDKAQQRIEERKKKGDTLAVNFQKLIDMLPKDISGFESGEPKGESINAYGLSYSNAECEYIKGESRIRIQLIDYNQAGALFGSYASIWNAGFERQSSEGFEKSYNPEIEDVYGWEKFNKASKNAELTLGVGYRFILVLNAEGVEGTDILKSIAGKMPLKELAKM